MKSFDRNLLGKTVAGKCSQGCGKRLKDAGLSLTEIFVVLAIILIVAGIGVPILLEALKAVRGLMALVCQVVVR